MKIFISVIVGVMCFIQLSAQNHFYYYQGQQVALQINHEELYLAADADFNAKSIFKNEGLTVQVSEKGTYLSDQQPQYWQIVKITSKILSEADYAQLVVKLKDAYNLLVEPVFGDQETVALSNLFYVKLKSENDVEVLTAMAQKNNAQILGQVKFMPAWFTLRTTAHSANSLELANQFYETGSFEDVDPGIMFDFSTSCISDPQFSAQWGFLNTSNPNADVNACPAWSMTLGAGPIVAVLDQGIEATHGEFSTNLSPTSFDALSGSSPASLYGSHGTHVAGTVAANQNGNQVSGLAPDATLMAVSHSLSLTPSISSELASGISWAWMNGADAINNSWGDQGGAYYTQLQSAVLENAITDALTLGRGGLGTSVIFAAGNYSGIIDYPAYFTPDILVVGSIAQSGIRSSFSGYGPELDVVAPGSNILSTIPGNSTGYSSGTSMAAPHVAGLVALILSVQPCLDQLQVATIIEHSSQKLAGYSFVTTVMRPNGTWNGELGYGLIDAEQAVIDAIGTSCGCPPDITVTTTYISADVVDLEASNSITAINHIESGAIVDYDAGNFIRLSPGFQAQSGSVFHAFIDGCGGMKTGPTKETFGQYDFSTADTKESSAKLETGSMENNLFTLTPNPFQSTTTIQYQLEESTTVKLTVFDLNGRLIQELKNENQSAGLHRVNFEAKNLPAGVYYVHLNTGISNTVEKLILVR